MQTIEPTDLTKLFGLDVKPEKPWLLDELQAEWESMMLNLDDAQKYLDEGHDDLCRVKIQVVRRMLEKRKARQ